jgi:propanol-preferring alcohol dehydrogenase
MRAQVSLRIETSGLCHTDIHPAHGDWPVKPTPRRPPRRRVQPASDNANHIAA